MKVKLFFAVIFHSLSVLLPATWNYAVGQDSPFSGNLLITASIA